MIITQTPFRVSLLGGNTDFPDYYLNHGGAFLSLAIDKYIYCIIKERFDEDIWITYSIKEKVQKVEDIKHDLVREAMNLLGVEKGVEIMFLGDIPSEGSGLGSSSAVTVGVLNALHNYLGDPTTALQLAKEAIKIECQILKKPIGVQDQYITAFGGSRLFQIGFDYLINEKVKISDCFMRSLILLYTEQTRNANDILSKMKLDKDILDKNKEMALLGGGLMEKDNIKDFGKLLDDYWQLKKKLNGAVTNPTIEDMYQRVKKAGAYGGKIVGAGGGGFLLAVVPPECREKVRALGYRELPFNLANDGSKVIFNIRR